MKTRQWKKKQFHLTTYILFMIGYILLYFYYTSYLLTTASFLIVSVSRPMNKKKLCKNLSQGLVIQLEWKTEELENTKVSAAFYDKTGQSHDWIPSASEKMNETRFCGHSGFVFISGNWATERVIINSWLHKHISINTFEKGFIDRR